MASIADIVIRAQDEASGTIRRVASELRSVPATGETIRLETSDGGSTARTTSNLRQLENAEIALSRTSRDYSTAIRQISSAMANANGDETRRLQLERQLTTVLQQRERAEQAAANASKSGGGDGLLGKLGSGAGSLAAGLGLALGAQQLVQFGVSAVQSANALEKTEATTRILAGSTARYNEVLTLAQQGQQKYGGTLQENLSGLGAFVNMANKTGASLQLIDTISRKLQLKSPEQGVEGAMIALNELANDTGASATHSLQTRFELSRTALKGLGDEGVSVQARMERLNKVLADQGFTDAALAASANTTAHAYDLLGAAWDNAKTSLGGLLARMLTAHQVGGPDNSAAGLLQGTANLAGGGQFRQSDNTAILQQTRNYQSYAAAVEQFNAKLPILDRWATGIRTLTPLQYQLTQALMHQGATADQALLRAQGTVNVENLLTQSKRAQTDAILQGQVPALLQLASTNSQVALGIQNLIGSYLAGKITGEQLTLAVHSMTGAQQLQTGATQQNTVATAENAQQKALAELQEKNTGAASDLLSAILAGQSGQLGANAEAAQIAAIQHAALASAEAQSGAQASAAIGSYLAAGGAMNAMALQALQARDAVAALALAQGATEIKGANAQQRRENLILGGDDPRTGYRGAVQQRAQDLADPAGAAQRSKAAQEAARQFNAEQQAQSAAAKAQREYAYATGDSATKHRILNQELAEAGKNTAAYWAAKQKLAALDEQESKAAARPARGAGALASSQDRLATAGQSKQEQLDYWQNKAAGLKVGSAAYNNALAKAHALEAQIAKEGGAATLKAGKAAAKDASELDRARENAATAGLDTAGELRYWKNKLGTLKQGSVEYLNTLAKVKDLEARVKREGETGAGKDAAEAARIQKAKDELLSTEERLATYRQRLAGGKLPELDRLEYVKQIKDLEEKIIDEKRKAADDERDAALAAIDDHKKRREEVKQTAAAQRVLASASTSAEQKAAAQDVLDRVPLEQAKRADDILRKQEEAAKLRADTATTAGATSGKDYGIKPVGGITPIGNEKPQPVTIAQPTLPPLSAPGLAAAAAALNLTIPIEIKLPDGTTLGTGTATYSGAMRSGPIATMRVALKQDSIARTGV